MRTSSPRFAPPRLETGAPDPLALFRDPQPSSCGSGFELTNGLGEP